MMIVIDSCFLRWSLRIGSILNWLLLVLLGRLLGIALIGVGILAVGRGRWVLVVWLTHWYWSSYFPDNI